MFHDLEQTVEEISAHTEDTREIKILVRSMRRRITERITQYSQKHSHITFKTIFDYDDDRYDFGATTVIPNAVVFDYYDDYEDEYDDDYEPTNADLEEEVSFSALEEALNRHKQVYGDTRKGRRNRYHDYGFGMGITFDGPDYEDDEDY